MPQGSSTEHTSTLTPFPPRIFLRPHVPASAPRVPSALWRRTIPGPSSPTAFCGTQHRLRWEVLDSGLPWDRGLGSPLWRSTGGVGGGAEGVRGTT